MSPITVMPKRPRNRFAAGSQKSSSIHRAKNVGLAEDGGLGNNDVVHILYGCGEGGIERDDFGDVAQEGNVSVDAVFGQRVKLPKARITQNFAAS